MKKLVLLCLLISVSAFAEIVVEAPEVKDGNELVASILEDKGLSDSTHVVYLEVSPEHVLPQGYYCSVTLSSGGGTSTGYGYGDTLNEACHNATDNAMNGGWSWDF